MQNDMLLKIAEVELSIDLPTIFKTGTFLKNIPTRSIAVKKIAENIKNSA